MREAIGGSQLFYIVIIIVSAVIILFTSALVYSKAYKAKNRIVEIIENNDGYAGSEDAIKDSLAQIGYQIGTCPKNAENNTSGYKYCVEEITAKNGIYYKVTTYVHFNFPIIGSIWNIPVTSTTKILNKSYDY